MRAVEGFGFWGVEVVWGSVYDGVCGKYRGVYVLNSG